MNKITIRDSNLVHTINTDHIVEIKYFPDTDETQFVLTRGEVWAQGRVDEEVL